MSSGSMGAQSLSIPSRALVLLIGSSGSGKSTFARKHFRATQVVSSDHCRALLCDDESDQSATSAAFRLLHFIVARRMEFGRLSVVDATNVEPSARTRLLELARKNAYPAIGIVFDIGLDAALANNRRRHERKVGDHIVSHHVKQLKVSKTQLSKEGFTRVYVLESVEHASSVHVVVRY